MGLCANLALITVFLGTGSLNTISTKLIFQSDGVTKTGEIANYNAEWFSTFIMFCGELFCFVIYGVMRLVYNYCLKEKFEKKEESLSRHERQALTEKRKYALITTEELTRNPTGGLGWKYWLYVTLFATLDIGGTTLGNIGYNNCDASIIQIIRGFVIVFTMIVSRIILKAVPVNYQYIGVAFLFLGLILVGVSAVLNALNTNEFASDGGVAGVVQGIGLTLVGQVFAAFQYTLEEKLLKQDDGSVAPIPPLFLVGSEGLAGFILCLAVVLPICSAIPGKDHGSYENMSNSFYMFAHNSFICGMYVLQICSISVFNWCGFIYSKNLSAATRTCVDTMRTVVVWIVMVICFYATKGDFGESFTKYTTIQVVGFVFMVIGTITHGNVFHLGSLMTRNCTKDASIGEDLVSKSEDDDYDEDIPESV